jgi:hypothetical protein
VYPLFSSTFLEKQASREKQDYFNHYKKSFSHINEPILEKIKSQSASVRASDKPLLKKTPVKEPEPEDTDCKLRMVPTQ